jgi:ketosteroid isomerase-like protein
MSLFETFARAVAAADRQAFMDLVHPDASLVTVPDWPDGGEFIGREAVWQFMSGFMAAFPRGHWL